MTTLHILSPADLVPGATSPSGRTVATAMVMPGDTYVTVVVTYEEGGAELLAWPSAAGWSSPAGHESVTHPQPKEARS